MVIALRIGDDVSSPGVNDDETQTVKLRKGFQMRLRVCVFDDGRAVPVCIGLKGSDTNAIWKLVSHSRGEDQIARRDGGILVQKIDEG